MKHQHLYTGTVLHLCSFSVLHSTKTYTQNLTNGSLFCTPSCPWGLYVRICLYVQTHVQVSRLRMATLRSIPGGIYRDKQTSYEELGECKFTVWYCMEAESMPPLWHSLVASAASAVVSRAVTCAVKLLIISSNITWNTFLYIVEYMRALASILKQALTAGRPCGYNQGAPPAAGRAERAACLSQHAPCRSQGAETHIPVVNNKR